MVDDAAEMYVRYIRSRDMLDDRHKWLRRLVGV